MALPPLPPFDPNNPTPNDPFYSPQTTQLNSTVGTLILGEGFTVTPEGILSATGVTTEGVRSIHAGRGIFVTGNTGDIAISNDGILNVLAGQGITINLNAGVAEISADTLGTVTSVGVGYGLGISGPANPITDSGVIILTDTGVSPGVYTAPQIQVDEKGRIISASSNVYVSSVTASSPVNATAGVNPVISVDFATTAQPGVVQLSDSVTTVSSTTAATSAAVQIAYATADAAIPKALLTGKGALVSASSTNTPTTVAVGADGQILVADSTSPSGVKWDDNDEGTVTLINTGTGLTGGPIDVTGTISLADTAVTPGDYTNASFSVDAQGRIYAASSGAAPILSVTGTTPIQVTAGQTPVVSVDAASTLTPGVVQLYDATDSTSAALALTAAAGKSLQDQIDALVVSNNLTLAGTLDASTGFVLTVTIEGSANGFVVGQPLPVAAPVNAEYFVITRVDGTFTPPGGGAVTASQGDWFLSNGTAWQYLDIGASVQYATVSDAGIVTLATDAETQAGTESTKAVVPSALQSKLSDSVATTSSTTIASSTAVKTAWDLADAAVPKATYTALGDIVSGTGAGTFVALAVGADGQTLVADSTAPSGLKWVTPFSGVSSITAGTGLTGGTITTSGTINLADTAVTPGVYNYAGIIVDQQGRITAATNGAVPLTPSAFTAKGDTLIGTGNGSFVALNSSLIEGDVLTVSASSPTGVAWVASTDGTVTSVTAGTGLTGGTITGSGTIDLDDTTVIPGSYTYSNIVVDQQGRITGANSGADPLPLTGGTMTGTITFSGAGIGIGFDSGRGLTDISDSVASTANYVAASSQAVKTAYDLALSASLGGIPTTAFTAKGDLLAGTGNNAYIALSAPVGDGKILTSSSSATSGLVWANPPASGIVTLTSGSPSLTVTNNPDTQNLRITVDSAAVGTAGVVELSNSEFSTSTSTAPTSRVASLAFNTAQTALLLAGTGGLSSTPLAYVSWSNGDNGTAAFGTLAAYRTISQAVFVAPQEATIIIAPGVYVENIDLTDKNITFIGSSDAGTDAYGGSGVTVAGKVTISQSSPTLGNYTEFNNISFYEPNATGNGPLIEVLANSGPTQHSINFNNCVFRRFYGPDPSQAYIIESTASTWSAPINFNGCSFYGNIKMNAGATDGSGAVMNLRNCITGFSQSDHIKVEAGTLNIINTSSFLPPIRQTGGTLTIENAGLGILANDSTTSSVFGGTGYSYLGDSAGANQGALEFLGLVHAHGTIDVNSAIEYSLDGLATSLANVDTTGATPMYTPGVSDRAVFQSGFLQSGQLTTPSTLAAADQYAVVVKDDGTINRVSDLDAGSY
jgi:hypothetical protein